MTSLADLHRAVQATLASKRLGKPVFVRYLVHGLLEKEGPAVLPALARLAAVVGDWMGQPPGRLYSLFSEAGGKAQTTVTLQFPQGATAVLSHVGGQAGPPGVELTVLGTRGAAYHPYAPGSNYLWQGARASLGDRRGAEILAALEDSREKGTNPIKVHAPQPKPTPPRPPEPPRREGKVVYGVLLVTGNRTHQENYAAAFAADPRCKLVAVTDELDIDKQRRELNERLARALGVPYEPDLDKALARKDVQVVSVCAPPERRGRIIVRCAEAGKHLYLDKSLAPRLEEAEAVVAAVRKAGVRSHMFTLNTQPWAREAKRQVEAGKLGKLLAIHADVFFAKGRPGTARVGAPRQEEYPPQRHQLVEAKRELDNVGVYPVALVRWITGQKFRTVFGVTGNYFFQEHQKHNVEDFGLLACTLEDGLPVTLAVGRYGWTSHPAGGLNRLTLVGSERIVVIDANEPRLEVSTDEPPWLPPNVNPTDPMGFWTSTQEEVHARPKRTWVPLNPPGQSDASYFLDCLEANRDSEMSAAEAALATEVLLAGYRSAASGAVSRLPLAEEK